MRTHSTLAAVLLASHAMVGHHAVASPVEARTTQQAPGRQPTAAPLRFEPATIDLGAVAPASRHPVRFVVRNISQKPVVIEDTRSSCKCTAITSLAGITLAPNASAVIDATMDAPTVPGEKDAFIYVTVQGADRPAVAKISAIVRMAVEANPYYIDIRGGKLSSVVHVRSIDGRPFRVLSAGGEAPKFVSTGDGAGKDPSTPQLEWYLEADFSRTPTDKLMQYWVVETDRDDCPLVPVQVRHELTGVKFDEGRDIRFWIFGDSLANAGRLRVGESYEGVIDISPHNPRRGVLTPPRPDWGEVRSLQATSPLAKVELLGVEPHGDKVSVRYRFTPTAEAAGKCIYEPVELRTATGAGRFYVTASVVDAPKDGTKPSGASGAGGRGARAVPGAPGGAP